MISAFEHFKRLKHVTIKLADGIQYRVNRTWYLMLIHYKIKMKNANIDITDKYRFIEYQYTQKLETFG